jgi:hypothetical protein
MDKKVRRSNFSKVSKEYLVTLVEESIKVVENKVTDAKTSAEKDAEWDNIARRFNRKFPGNLKTGNQLRTSWRNLKKSAKREFAKRRRSKRITGGGEGEPDADPLIAKVVTLVPKQIQPLRNKFDSDAPLDFSRRSKSHSETESTEEEVESDTDDEEDPRETEQCHSARKFTELQGSVRDKAYMAAEKNDNAYHELRMSQVRLEMAIAEQTYDDDKRRKDEAHELTMEIKRKKLAFWSAQTASLQALDDKIMDSLP